MKFGKRRYHHDTMHKKLNALRIIFKMYKKDKRLYITDIITHKLINVPNNFIPKIG